MTDILSSTLSNSSPEVSRSVRRRTPGSSNRKSSIKQQNNVNDDINNNDEKEEKVKIVRPRVPVPPEFIGTTQTGIVSYINSRDYKNKFGFIHICPGKKIDNNAPRIYFNLNAVKESTTIIIRRSYLVSFSCNLDDQQRAYAADIELTEEGIQVATLREASIEKKRKLASEQQAITTAAVEGGGGGVVGDVLQTVTSDDMVPKKERKGRRQQLPPPSKPIVLKVSCEGKADIQLLTFSKRFTLGIQKLCIIM
jgi:hypothetical protein